MAHGWTRSRLCQSSLECASEKTVANASLHPAERSRAGPRSRAGDPSQVVGDARGRYTLPAASERERRRRGIDEALARRLFPGQDAIGKLIGPWPPGMRVVGVAGDVKQSDLAAPSQVAGAICFATAGTQARQTILLRTRQSASSVVALLRGTLADLDPELAVHDVQPLAALVSRSVGARQVASWLLTGFAALSLVLCVVGVFGVLNYTFSQRAKELGVRLAHSPGPRRAARRSSDHGSAERGRARHRRVGRRGVRVSGGTTVDRRTHLRRRPARLVVDRRSNAIARRHGARSVATLSDSRCTGGPSRGTARRLTRFQNLASYASNAVAANIGRPRSYAFPRPPSVGGGYSGSPSRTAQRIPRAGARSPCASHSESFELARRSECLQTQRSTGYKADQ